MLAQWLGVVGNAASRTGEYKSHDGLKVVTAYVWAAAGFKDTLRFEQRNKDIIVRFGRSPYSNALLGSESTPEELAFLSEPGSGFNPLSMASGSPMRYNMDLIVLESS